MSTQQTAIVATRVATDEGMVQNRVVLEKRANGWMVVGYSIERRRPRDLARPALLLTGGASRRLGTDKATIVWHGETLAARAARVLAQVCAPVLEVGPGVTSLPRRPRGSAGSRPARRGARGRARARGGSGAEVDAVVVLACDMPFVEPPLLRLLADVAGHRHRHPDARRARAVRVRALREGLVARRRGVAGTTSFKAVTCGRRASSSPRTRGATVAPANAFDDIDTPADRARTIGQ